MRAFQQTAKGLQAATGRKVPAVVVRQRGGGFAMSISFSNKAGYKKNWIFPNTFNYLSGKVDWIAQSGEFTLPADAPSDLSGCIMPFVRFAVGSAWLDGVLLEEVK